MRKIRRRSLTTKVALQLRDAMRADRTRLLSAMSLLEDCRAQGLAEPRWRARWWPVHLNVRRTNQGDRFSW